MKLYVGSCTHHSRLGGPLEASLGGVGVADVLRNGTGWGCG